MTPTATTTPATPTPTRTPTPTPTPWKFRGSIDGPLCFERSASPEEREAAQAQCSAASTSPAPGTDVTLAGYNIHFDGVSYNLDGTSTWSYTITPVSATKAMNYWILGWFPGRPLLSVSPPAAVVLDWASGIYGIKWSQKLLPTDPPRTYTFTVKGHWEVGESDVFLSDP